MITNKTFKQIYESIVGTEDTIELDGLCFEKNRVQSFELDEIGPKWRISIRYIIGINPRKEATPYDYGIYEGTKEECEKIAHTLQEQIT